MDLGRVPAHHRDTCSRLDERACHERVLPEDRGADGEHDIVRRERLTQPYPIGRQVTREEGVVLREAGAGAERLLPDRAGEPLGQIDERRPGVGIVRPRPDDEHRALCPGEEVRELRDDVLVHRPRAQDAAGRGPLGGIDGVRRPVVHRHDDDGGAVSRLCLVVGAGDRAGNVLGAHRLVDPDGVVARQAVQPACEERLGREVTPVLLADDAPPTAPG